MSDLNWDEFESEPEKFTEEDQKEIDEGQKVIPVGRYLCRVVDSTPRRIDFNAYSCIGTRLKFEIEKCLEIEAKPVEGDEGEEYEGRHIYDDVAFKSDAEKNGMAKRRKYVALRLGIIKPGEFLRKDMWRDDVIGKEVILRLMENRYKDKNGQEKVGAPRIGFFDGYEYADQSDQAASQETWDDI